MSDAAVAVAGATGFIGRHFLPRLLNRGINVRALTRGSVETAGVEWVRGELRDPAAVAALVEGARVVVNLAFSADQSQEANVAAAASLARAAVRAGVSRFVHCSTAVVAGDCRTDLVDESTACVPRTPYEKTKFAIEQEVLSRGGAMSVTVIRPTAVFGDGGENLLKLIDEAQQSSLLRLAAGFVRGNRVMNLVPVEDVVEALDLLAEGFDPPGPILIVSRDELALNAYQPIARIITEEIGRSGVRSPVTLPQPLFSSVMRALERETAPVRRRYITRYPEWQRRTSNVDFEVAVRRFARSVARST